MPEFWQIRAVLHLSLPPLWSRAVIKHSQIRLFKLISSYWQTLPRFLWANWWATSSSRWDSFTFCKTVTTLLWNSYLSCSYPVIVVSVSWIRGMEISKKLSLRLCSGLALKETKISESEYFAYNYLCRSIFTFAVIFELLTFLLELRTATCHLLQRAESCQKSLQNDTAKTKKTPE